MTMMKTKTTIKRKMMRQTNKSKSKKTTMMISMSGKMCQTNPNKNLKKN